MKIIINYNLLRLLIGVYFNLDNLCGFRTRIRIDNSMFIYNGEITVLKWRDDGK